MPNTIGRNLNLCFRKIKRPLASESQSGFLSPDNHKHPILVKNYNSLYDHILDDSLSTSSSAEPDFAAVFASQRFFFSSPGSSNSITDSKPSIATQSEASDTVMRIKTTHYTKDDDLPLVDTDVNSHEPVQSWNPQGVKNGVAVPTFSPYPYMDFRRSMQEMVEARDLVDVSSNWEHLHELLLCYLSLNPKNTHKFIVGAFADLLVSLLSSSTNQSDGRKERNMDAGE